DRSGIRALRALHESDSGAICPLLQLLDPGGPERVGRREHDGAVELVREVPGELADRGGLPGSVDAGDQDHRGVWLQTDPIVSGARDVGEQLDETVGERLATG